jgi:SAM-dependent methyltransferase
VGALYDRIGVGYAAIRKPDPRLAARIWRALGDARRIVNVGAGTGSYEPPDRDVVAVEPSTEMIAQRPPGSAPVVQASAEALPFEDGAFDAAMAILTMHHWADWRRGLAELTRVAPARVVLVTFDLDVAADFWLVRDYLPEAGELDRASFPSIVTLTEELGGATVDVLRLPSDCSDRMFAGLWARPEEYLDPTVRAGSSVWHRLPVETVDAAVARLRADLESGAWDARHGALRTTPEWDTGLRLVCAGRRLDT